MAKINIAHIVLKADLTGGPGHSLISLVTGLGQADFNHLVLTHQRGELIDRLRPLVAKIKFIRRHEIQRRFPIPFLVTLIRAWLFFKSQKIQIAHFQFHTYRDPVLMAAWLARVKTVLHIRGPATDFDDSWMYLADRFVFNSRFTESIARLDPELGSRAIVVHNALDAKSFAESVVRERDAVAAKLSIRPGQKIVAAVCRVHRKKELEHFLEVASILRDRSDLRFIIVGENQDPEYRTLLDAEALRLEIKDRVEFIGHLSNLPGFYAHLTVLVHPAPTEPFGRIILEAFASGVPVVGFNSGALPEIIESDLSGILVPYPDFSAMAKGVVRMLDHPNDRDRVVVAGRERLKKFNVETHVEKIAAIYRALIAQPPLSY